MPTYTFTRTREQMRDKIARLLGVKEEGQSLPSEDAVIIYEAMDFRLKELHTLGMLWWNVSGATTNLSLVGGTATVSLSSVTDFLFAVTVKLRVGTEDQEIEIIGHEQYQAVKEKADEGEPRKVFISGSTAYFWPTPDINYTAKLTYQAIAADVENGAAPDVPVSCMRAFPILVASDLCEDFNVSDSRAARIRSQYNDARDTIQIASRERVDTTRVAPEWF
jgi:hypothetical protein